MNHRRVLQEKEKLLNDIKRLEKNMKLYEPQIEDLKRRYDVAMKEKMMMKLERDKMKAKVESLEQVIAKYDNSEKQPVQKTIKPKPKQPKDSKIPSDKVYKLLFRQLIHIYL